jgi:hypothetical protein
MLASNIAADYRHRTENGGIFQILNGSDVLGPAREPPRPTQKTQQLTCKNFWARTRPADPQKTFFAFYLNIFTLSICKHFEPVKKHISEATAANGMRKNQTLRYYMRKYFISETGPNRKGAQKLARGPHFCHGPAHEHHCTMAMQNMYCK